MIKGRPPKNVAYQTKFGRMFHGKTEEILGTDFFHSLKGNVQLIFTSPPFPLVRKKRYGNLAGEQYVEWLTSFASQFRDLLKRNGSLVVELGNAWEAGQPSMSTLPIRALLALQEAGEFHLCQEIIWHNPARLPGPAQWVNVERIRLKDSHTRFWWFSKSPRPKANNRRVLQPYSQSMKALLKRKSYNAGRRPSQHDIGEASFLTNHGGSIAPSVITLANTRANDPYQQYCQDRKLTPHPARMPKELPEFFIKFLTDKSDLILDPFAGSNTTGYAAENLQRRWIGIEPNLEYIKGSRGRFKA